MSVYHVSQHSSCHTVSWWVQAFCVIKLLSTATW